MSAINAFLNASNLMLCSFRYKLLLNACKACSVPKQIISLGAGFDTLFFRLLQEPQISDLHYVEVDCMSIIEKKQSILTDEKHFQHFFGFNDMQHHASSKMFQCSIPSRNVRYTLLAADIGDSEQLESAFSTKLHLSQTQPTIILMECVLVM